MSERAYEDAERRLGRKLTDSERRIDILGYDRDLEEGKRKLFQAIEAEKARVIRARLAGRRAKLKVTPDMIAALAWLHGRGVAHAHAELRAAGIEPSRAYAAPPGLSGLLRTLRAMLGNVSRRVDRELKIRAEKKKVAVTITAAAQQALAKAMEKKVPGSLAIAADLVSSAMARGLDEGFEADADLFPCWIYSAVMDGATCPNCRALDGTRYPTWAAIMVVLPDGGPNPLCLGNGRCRCRPVPCPIDRLFLPEPAEKAAPSDVLILREQNAETEAALAGLDEHILFPANASRIPVALQAARSERRGTALGGFAISRRSGPLGIGIATEGDMPTAYTFWHESGHFLDALIGNEESGTWDMMSELRRADGNIDVDRLRSGPLGRIFDEMAASDTVQTILRMADVTESAGDPYGQLEALNYLLEPSELFARAFGEWMALRTGDEVAIRFVTGRGNTGGEYLADHWTREDFRPIAEALEAMLRARGLLR